MGKKFYNWQHSGHSYGSLINVSVVKVIFTSLRMQLERWRRQENANYSSYVLIFIILKWLIFSYFKSNTSSLELYKIRKIIKMKMKMWLRSHLLWLWYRPAAIAPIRPLAWEFPFATSAALKSKKKKKKRKKMKITHNFRDNCFDLCIYFLLTFLIHMYIAC